MRRYTSEWWVWLAVTVLKQTLFSVLYKVSGFSLLLSDNLISDNKRLSLVQCSSRCKYSTVMALPPNVAQSMSCVLWKYHTARYQGWTHFLQFFFNIGFRDNSAFLKTVVAQTFLHKHNFHMKDFSHWVFESGLVSTVEHSWESWDNS